ncbi:MAG: 2OG-Fe(II) oxygenase [Polyangiaceae bacterium]
MSYEPFRYSIEDKFFRDADQLRAAFEASVGDRTSPFEPARFRWEYWHVPFQFSQHRTPARTFFETELMRAFEERLLTWASRELGVSELGASPWLSYLIDRDFQALHRDSPNGQIAFSFGLSKPDKVRFRGGETLIARPELLDYWGQPSFRDHEAHKPLFDVVPAKFNRLVVFDSRIPHAVQMVEGPRVAMDGRVSIQGWLRANGCILDLNTSRAEVEAHIDRELASIDVSGVDGLYSVEIHTSTRRVTNDVTTKVSTLVSTSRAARVEHVVSELLAWAHRVSLPCEIKRVIVPIRIDGKTAQVARSS